MKVSRIPVLQAHTDWLEKAKREYSLFQKSCNVYDLTNCLLTLNALPEWIKNDDSLPQALVSLAIGKEALMRAESNCIQLDENKLHELDHQLRLVRTFCNHAKHGKEKEKLKFISMSTPFPITNPDSMRFDRMQVGDKNILMEPILESIISFWEKEITSCQ